MGNYTDTFTPAHTSSPGWETDISPTLAALAPGQAAIVLAQIAIPAGTMSGTVGQVGVILLHHKPTPPFKRSPR
ncbi:MAG: hypothetical protein R3E31_25765 [Chloroflexota bacterium]